MRLTRRSIAQLLDERQEPKHARATGPIIDMATLANVIDTDRPVFVRFRFTTPDELRSRTYSALSRLIDRRIVHQAIPTQE